MDKLVIDSTALIELPQLPAGDLYAPPLVLAEAMSLEPSLKAKHVTLKSPSPQALAQVEAVQKKTGDSVSPADKQAVALAVDLHATLVSDDYACQNIAAFLGLKFLPLSKPGITKKRIWRQKCPNCGQWLKAKECPVCGQAGKRTVFLEEPIA